MSGKPALDQDEVKSWLGAYLGTKIHNFEPLSGGFWSSAFAFEADAEDLVLRIAHDGEGFDIDQQAQRRFVDAQLPIPVVHEVGDYQTLMYAISQRHFGQVMETVDLRRGSSAIDSLNGLLAAMRRCKAQQGSPVVWYAPDDRDWVGYLMARFEKRARTPQAYIENLLDESVDVLRKLLEKCPERRDLIHGDLFHQNVLLNEMADKVTAVFSWKCSAMGDFLYDIAWSVFWGRWFVGFSDPHLADRLLGVADLSTEDLEDWELRLSCYQLHIAVTHIDWYINTSEPERLERMVASAQTLIAKAQQNWT